MDCCCEDMDAPTFNGLRTLSKNRFFLSNAVCLFDYAFLA
ncbi:hypothetical protein BURCENBC7_AP1031 [Burkholderia cenocepacia BC7]|nr:hypothetical protein BURCENK562V_C2352 [Burkholderia cenocepacia K56-2Valvano]ERI31740.1 hypothetical protein BURCENBC7_AP1031 [Burkholderia cenocepacia BC7]